MEPTRNEEARETSQHYPFHIFVRFTSYGAVLVFKKLAPSTFFINSIFFGVLHNFMKFKGFKFLHPIPEQINLNNHENEWTMIYCIILHIFMFCKQICCFSVSKSQGFLAIVLGFHISHIFFIGIKHVRFWSGTRRTPFTMIIQMTLIL